MSDRHDRIAAMLDVAVGLDHLDTDQRAKVAANVADLADAMWLSDSRAVDVAVPLLAYGIDRARQFETGIALVADTINDSAPDG